MAIATGVARPLVQREGWNIKSIMTWLGPFALGAAGGSLVTGALLAVGASSIASHRQVATIVAMTCASLFIVIDIMASQQYSVLSIPRQTCSTWFKRWASTRTFLLWGVDLGLGFSTFRVSALYWVVVIWVVAALGTTSAPLVMLAYAVGITSALTVAVGRDRGVAAATIRNRLYALLPRVRLGSNAVAVALAVTLMVERRPW